VLVSWIVGVGSIYMGVKVQAHDVRLDITRTSEKLGLAPYSRLVLTALMIYLLGYAITTWLTFTRFEPVYLAISGAFSILPIIGFVGSQYGLHRAIEYSKQKRLEELRREFSDDLELWFSSSAPEPTETESAGDLAEFIAAKEALEEIPEWPVNVASIVRLGSATFASNVWILFQLYGFIS